MMGGADLSGERPRREAVLAVRVFFESRRNRLTVMRGKKVKKIGPSRLDRTFKAGVYLQDSEFLAAALVGTPVRALLAASSVDGTL